MKDEIINLIIFWGSILFSIAGVFYLIWMLIAIDKKRKQSELERRENKYEDREY